MLDTTVLPPPARVDAPTAAFARRHQAGCRLSQRGGAHPFDRWVNPYLTELLRTLRLDKRFVRGQGCELIDEKGRRYLDCVSAYGALPFGFNPPEIWNSLRGVQQTAEPSFIQPSLLDAAGELAERLLEIAPGNLAHVTFTNSGAESVEAALKMCRVATGRAGILSTQNSFHGKTLGALSATGNPAYQSGFVAPTGEFRCIPFGDVEALRQALGERPGHYAAFVVEPIQGEGGVVVPPPGYLAAVQEVCNDAGVLLVLDEIQTGLARTGTMFRCQAENVQPDVITLAKALGGGLMPIGAVLASKAAYSEAFATKHSSTFAGNTLACRAGLAALDMLTRDNQLLVQRVGLYGARLRRRLKQMQQAHPQLLAEVRGSGFLLGLRFEVDREGWPESLLGVAGEQGFFAPLFASYMLNVEGVRVAPTLNGRGVIRIEPALTIRWRECERLLGALERTLDVFATGETGPILAAILEGRRPAKKKREKTTPPDWTRVRALPSEPRFGFLLHPLDTKSFVDFEPSLARLSQENLKTVAGNLSGLVEPFVLNRGRVVSQAGDAAYGEFVTLPWTAEQMSKMRRKEAIERVRGAVQLAKSRGAQMIGLGAFTSVVTLAGRAVADEGVAVTTGNSYTAVASAEAVRKAMTALHVARRGQVTAAIVGATGAIGRAMTLLLAEDVGRLILVGNPDSPPEQVRKRLSAVAADMAQFLLDQPPGGALPAGTVAAEVLAQAQSADADPARIVQLLEQQGKLVFSQAPREAVRSSQVAVTATSATDAVLRPDDMPHGAIVCDLSRPANVREEVAALRPDVLVIDGGVIAAPAGSQLGQFGLGDGLIYACMAETMLLTLGGHFENTSLGADLPPDSLQLVRTLAQQHGFHVAKLRSFGQPLDEEAWEKLIAARMQVPSAG